MNSANPLTSYVEKIFQKVGIAIFDDENKYTDVNYIAATESMKGAIYTADKLRKMKIKRQIIEVAIKQVFVGTAGQYPYEEPDYFHELVYKKNPGLKELNQDILKEV